jgi:ABC-type branched-subunit amino acid transport system ATPase component/ABC-type branched-subunit amino acid transport system permease subunit
VRAEILGAAAAVQGGLGKRPRRIGWVAFAVAMVIIVFPFIPQAIVPFSYKQDVVVAAAYLMAALSVVLLTGWVGQISLAQAEFVGVGAFFTAVLTNTFHVAFPASFILAALAGAAVAGALGIVALRVRGLYLAVATLVFAWMADKFLFNASWFGIVGGSATIPPVAVGSPNTIPYLDFTDIRVLYLAYAAIAAGMIYGLANLRESKTGRAFFAVRGSEVAASSLGIDVTRYKLLAFLVAGGMAGAAGNLAIVQGSAVPDSFNFLTSLFFLSVAVVGGLLSLGGAIAAAVVFAALHEVFLRVHALNGFLEIIAALVLLAVLLVYPGGLAAVPAGVTQAWSWLEANTPLGPFVKQIGRLLSPVGQGIRTANAAVGRVLAPPRRWVGAQVDRVSARGSDVMGRLLSTRRRPATVAVEPATITPSSNGNGNGAGPPAAPKWEGFAAKKRPGIGDPRPDRTVLQVSGVTVQFGGLTAVSQVDLALQEGEIVGLIGANGAGKTTLYNVISGLVTPVAGRVEIMGRDVTRTPVHLRARLGIARTFQEIQLFPQLTVFENLMVATHLQNSSHLHQHVLVTGGGLKSEAAARERVREVLDFLGLRHLSERRITDISFGLLRMVEVARALVTGAQVILLDEPASGLDNVESDRLTQLLLYIREELKVSMLVVEHDIRTVLALSDYMYVLDQGQLIGEGRPAEVQRSERVIEAYLGEAVVHG